MRTLCKALVLLVVLSGSILVHEYGHLLAMKAHGVQVVRFTIGFGPTLWSHTGSDGVEFAIKPIILGGFTESVAEGPHSMENTSRGAQIVIALVGTFVNACAGFILLLLLGTWARWDRRSGWRITSVRSQTNFVRSPPPQ